MTVPQNIIDIIKKDNIGNINMVWARDTNWYEVSVGLYNITVFYHIINGIIIDTIVD